MTDEEPGGRAPEAGGLAAFIGEWSMDAIFEGAPSGGPAGRCVFEWMPGERFLVQRWEVPYPDAPDGIAIITFDPASGAYRQHYFDSRGVVRLYEMSLADGVWKLWRTTEDFSPLPFQQRFEARFSEDGSTIAGAWELTDDTGEWQHDFDLVFRRVS